MSAERAALVAGILASPDDDAPRLVCADWFEEQGDPANVARAEFIRVQVERARLSPTDARQPELQARELRLLKEHGAAWAGSHFAFKKCRFRRGFIEYVHLHLTHFLHHRRQLLALEPVRDVSLTGWMRAKEDLVARVAACEEWKHVHTLRIHHQGPHKDPRSPLAVLLWSPHLTGLRSLRVPRLSLTRTARRRLERAPVLRRLHELTLPDLDTFPDNAGEWLEDGGAFLPWEKLRTLRLRDYSVRPDLLRRLVAMPFWNKLTELDVNIGWNRVPEIDQLRNHLPASLNVLRLNGGSPWEGEPAMDALFTRIAHLPLRGLHIAGIPLRAEWLAHVFGPSSRCELQELTLSGCELRADHARVIADSPRVRNVWSLDLSQNWQFPAVAAEIIFECAYLPSVARLNLTNTPIGASGAKSLAASGWTGLRSLALSGADLYDREARELFASPAFQSVVSLHYVGNDQAKTFKPALAEQLAELPHLASLRLESGSPLSKTARTALQSSESLAWVTTDPEDHENWGNFDPNVLPPLDEELAHADQHSS